MSKEMTIPKLIIRTALLLMLGANSVGISQAQDLQAPPRPDPDGRFKADILLIVAHPDDEAMISSYLARAIYDRHKSAI